MAVRQNLQTAAADVLEARGQRARVAWCPDQAFRIGTASGGQPTGSDPVEEKREIGDNYEVRDCSFTKGRCVRQLRSRSHCHYWPGWKACRQSRRRPRHELLPVA